MSTNPERAVSYVLTKPVSQYMTKDVLVLNHKTPTTDATRVLQHYERDDIIVTDDSNQPIGIVTDEDILNKVSDVTVYAEATTLKDIMSTPLITISERATIQDALHKMRDNGIRKLPVISRKNEVVGIILQSTIADIIRGATATPPRLLSPRYSGKLGICVTVCRSIVASSCDNFYNNGRNSNCNWNLSYYSAFVSYWILFEFVW